MCIRLLPSRWRRSSFFHVWRVLQCNVILSERSEPKDLIPTGKDSSTPPLRGSAQNDRGEKRGCAQNDRGEEASAAPAAVPVMGRPKGRI